MVRPKPFLFEFSFDDGADEARQADEEARIRAAEEEEANRPPTFTLEEFEAAKAQAHAQGRQEGMDDAIAGIEQQIARTLDTVFARLPKVFEQHENWVREMEADAVRLATTVMRKLAPEITRELELPEVEHVIREAFGFLTEQPKVMIRVAQELDDPLKDKVNLMASRVGYEGQVVLVGDPELPLDDCRISWQAGAVERSLDDVWSQIDEIVNRGLAGQPTRTRAEPATEPDQETLEDQAQGPDAEPVEEPPTEETLVDPAPELASEDAAEDTAEHAVEEAAEDAAGSASLDALEDTADDLTEDTVEDVAAQAVPEPEADREPQTMNAADEPDTEATPDPGAETELDPASPDGAADDPADPQQTPV